VKEKKDKKKKVPSGEAEAEGTRGSARLDGLWPGQACKLREHSTSNT
jgi:hypothetical protein